MRKSIRNKARSFLMLLLTLGLQQAIAQPTSSVTSATNASCFGTATGSISVSFSHSASTTFTVELDSASQIIQTFTTTTASTTGSHTFNNVHANTYRVKVKENTTSTTRTLTGITITQPAALVLTSSVYNVTCNGLNNGGVKLFGNGGTTSTGTYVFKKGTGSFATTDTFGNFSPGGYLFYVSDDNGCYDTLSVTITQPSVLGLSITVSNSICNGGATVDLSGFGGTAPYKFDLFSSGTY